MAREPHFGACPARLEEMASWSKSSSSPATGAEKNMETSFGPPDSARMSPPVERKESAIPECRLGSMMRRMTATTSAGPNGVPSEKRTLRRSRKSMRFP